MRERRKPLTHNSFSHILFYKNIILIRVNSWKKPISMRNFQIVSKFWKILTEHFFSSKWSFCPHWTLHLCPASCSLLLGLAHWWKCNLCGPSTANNGGWGLEQAPPPFAYSRWRGGAMGNSEGVPPLSSLVVDSKEVHNQRWRPRARADCNPSPPLPCPLALSRT